MTPVRYYLFWLIVSRKFFTFLVYRQKVSTCIFIVKIKKHPLREFILRATFNGGNEKFSSTGNSAMAQKKKGGLAEPTSGLQPEDIQASDFFLNVDFDILEDSDTPGNILILNNDQINKIKSSGIDMGSPVLAIDQSIDKAMMSVLCMDEEGQYYLRCHPGTITDIKPSIPETYQKYNKIFENTKVDKEAYDCICRYIDLTSSYYSGNIIQSRKASSHGKEFKDDKEAEDLTSLDLYSFKEKEIEEEITAVLRRMSSIEEPDIPEVQKFAYLENLIIESFSLIGYNCKCIGTDKWPYRISKKFQVETEDGVKYKIMTMFIGQNTQ